MPVGDPVRQDVPDRHEQPPSDGYDGFAASQPVFQPLELFLPIGMVAYGGIGRIHHGAAQVAPPGLGDMAGGMHLAAVVNAGTQPGIAHQVAGIFEALDRPDGGQDGESLSAWRPLAAGLAMGRVHPWQLPGAAPLR